ncbi:MAG: hypothetical protein WC552_08240 [Candidatus Omnitrophota bacterium]
MKNGENLFGSRLILKIQSGTDLSKKYLSVNTPPFSLNKNFAGDLGSVVAPSKDTYNQQPTPFNPMFYPTKA